MSAQFYLDITEAGETTSYAIDEFFGYDGTRFMLKQESGRFGRDRLFTGGEIDAEFTRMRNHQLDRLLYLFDRYGFEAKAAVRIVTPDESLSLDINFQDAETDGLTYLKCNLIQDATLQVIKRRRDIKVDLHSDKDIDGNDIEPLPREKILLLAKPVFQRSTWKYGMAQPKFFGLAAESSFNFSNATEDYEIDDSIGFIQGAGEPDQFKYIKAENNLSAITVRLTNIDVKYHSGWPSSGDVRLAIKYGETMETATAYIAAHIFPGQAFATNYTFTLPYLPRGHYIWIYFRVEGGGVNMLYSSMDVEITATSTAFNSIVDTVRLIDAQKQVIKSISGVDVDAPRFDQGGEFYDQRLIIGNALRGKVDAAFPITLKDIGEGLPEFCADYEIQPDNKVFFGIYEDFYQDQEIGFFPNTQFDGFSKGFNPRYTCNKFSFKYKNYQSQRENSQENTVDEVHGESEWTIPNLNVENHREIKVDWTRSVFLLESTRRAGFNVKDSAATQDDDKVFIVDVYPDLPASLYFNESALLQMQYDADATQIVVRNDQTFNWLLLGITPGQSFTILPGQINAGIYLVVSVTDQELVISGGPGTTTATRVIRFTYYINTATLHGVNWTNQGFPAINEIANGHNYGNLRFSNKRNILKYHKKYLSSCNYYKKNLYLANTFYKNNAQALTSYDGLSIVEGDPFLADDPLLSPVLYKDCVFIAPLAAFITLQHRLRTQRGFVRFIDNEGIVRKMYAQELSYEPFGEKLIIEKGEEKHEPAIINIVTNANGTKTINNEYTVMVLKWEPQGDRIRITDNEGYLLYNPVFWNRIALNGNLFDSQLALQENLLLV